MSCAWAAHPDDLRLRPGRHGGSLDGLKASRSSTRSAPTGRLVASNWDILCYQGNRAYRRSEATGGRGDRRCRGRGGSRWQWTARRRSHPASSTTSPPPSAAASGASGDPEPRAGLARIGRSHPDHLAAGRGGDPGDLPRRPQPLRVPRPVRPGAGALDDRRDLGDGTPHVEPCRRRHRHLRPQVKAILAHRSQHLEPHTIEDRMRGFLRARGEAAGMPGGWWRHSSSLRLADHIRDRHGDVGDRSSARGEPVGCSAACGSPSRAARRRPHRELHPPGRGRRRCPSSPRGHRRAAPRSTSG